jgi:hypothetical protein
MSTPAPTAPAESAGASVSEPSGLKSQPSSEPPVSGLSPQVSSGLLPAHFLEAWLNLDHTVCRRALPPYSLHAHMMLCAANSPFAFEALPAGYQVTWEDLWEALTLVTTPRGRPVVYPSGARCVIRQRFYRLDLAREVAAFRAWQNDYLSAPEVFSSEGGGRELTAPGILARVVFLLRHLHLTASEVWGMPIGQALWLHAATLEQLSESVSLLGDEEAKLFALVKGIQEGTTPIPGEPDPSTGDSLLSRVAQLAGIHRN